MIPSTLYRSLSYTPTGSKKMQIAEGDFQHYVVEALVLPAEKGIQLGQAPEGFRAKKIIYSDPFSGYPMDRKRGVSMSTGRVLDKAEKEGIASVAFPALIEEPYKFPVGEWVATVAEEVRVHFQDSTAVMWVGLIFPGMASYKEAEAILFKKNEARPTRFYR